MKYRILLSYALLFSNSTFCQEPASFYNTLTKKSIISYIIGLGFFSGCIYGICKKYPENAIVRHLKKSYTYIKNRFWNLQERPSSKINTITAQTQKTNLSVEKSELEHIQEQLLDWLEKDIETIVQDLPNNLKKYLPRWNENFEIFKKTSQKIKTLYRQSINIDNADTQIIDIFYSLLGLKFCTIITDDLFIGTKTKYIIDNVISNFKDILLTDNSKTLFFTINNPLFIPIFVYTDYSTNKALFEIKISIDFTSFITQNPMNQNSLINWINKFIERTETDNQNEDNWALLLGLQPTYLEQPNNDQFYLLTDNELNYRYILLPGKTAFVDTTSYIRLYSKLAEYFWITFWGIKDYKDFLNKKLTTLNDKSYQIIKQILQKIKTEDKGADLLLQAIELIEK